MSYRITVRLSDQEKIMLDSVAQSDQRGDLTSGELVRLLIHREYNRRHGLPSPEASQYQADFRKGRPRKNV